MTNELPVDFREIDCVPEGYVLSDRVQDPVLMINRSGGKIAATLAAKIKSAGVARYIAAISLAHNWILDGFRVKPLPVDIAQIVEKVLEDANPNSLTLPEVLRIQRNNEELIPIEIQQSVFQTANERAHELAKEVKVPGLEANLYTYQKEGVAWMQQTLQHTSGIILADEMGLGKTMQIIALFLLDPPCNGSPALIVCPTTLIANWCRELIKFSPALTVLVHRGSARTGVFKGLMRSQIVITTYETLVNDCTIFEAVDWSFLVCDEAQAIKNPSSKRRGAVARLSRTRSIPVTGTPVENSLTDLWSLCDIAIPGLLGSRSEFEMLYPNSEEGADDVARATNPIILRRLIRDVAGDLPERIDIDLPLEMDPSLAERYEAVRTETLEKYPTAGALVATGQLALFCAHPSLRSKAYEHENWEDHVTFDESQEDLVNTPKVELTVSLLSEAFSSNRKVIVFANYNACGRIIRKASCSLRSAYWGAINGSTPEEDRQKTVDEFSAHDGPAVLILNPRAAGSGLNITAATIVIHFTPVWNPALEMQASARAHRRGQAEPVTIYRLYYQDTIEEVMLERSAWKRALANTSVPITTRDESDRVRALTISPIKEHE